MHRSVRLAGAAVAMALLSTTALAGCFGGNPVEQIIEEATGGEVSLPGAAVPEGFPTEEVPLVDGEIVMGLGVGSAPNQVFNVTVKTDGDPTTAVVDALVAAGFTEQTAAQATTDQGTSRVFTGDSWGVLVVIGQVDGAWNANYTVTQTS